MKYKLITSILILFSFTLSSSFSNDKVAYLDMEKVLNLSKVGISFNNQLTKLHKSNIEYFKKIEIDLKKEEKDILSKKNILEKTELEKKLNTLRDKSNKYRIDRKKKIDSLTKKRIEKTNEILKKIQPILTDYSKSNSISLILAKKSIIIGKIELDITEEIIEVLNSKIQKINLD